MLKLVGLEQEYRLLDGQRIDFRSVIHRLGLETPHFDPADLNAYRIAGGAVLTCDESEAEVALPPASIKADFTAEVVARARTARADLKQLLLRDVRTEGYSTHISISIHPRYNERAALLFARTFAPALMLLMDGPHSPGLLVRPRPNRLELGGEYVAGVRLRAALAFAVGGVFACVANLREGGKLPPRLSLRLSLDDQRYGWYVDRRAFGPDLYREGRKARLVRDDGGIITAQEQLEVSWAIAREALAGIASDDDLEPADRMVSGDIPLPTEQPDYQDNSESVHVAVDQNVYGRVLDPRNRPGFDLAPVMVTWDVCVFVIVNPDRSRRAFACVPRDYLESFVEQLDSGGLDAIIHDYLSHPATGRRLYQYGQTHEPGFYDLLGPRINLLAPELHPRAKRWRRLLIARRVERPLRRAHDDAESRVAVPLTTGV